MDDGSGEVSGGTPGGDVLALNYFDTSGRTVVAAASAPSCLPLPSSAVAWWRAESNSVDSVGLNDALVRGPSILGTSFIVGKVGAAFRFVSKGGLPPPWGTPDVLFVPASDELDLGAGAGLTIEGWIKPSSLSTFQPILEWNDGRGNIGAGAALNGSALEGSLTDTNSTPIRRLTLRSPVGLIGTSAWQHAALTFDRASGLATLFANGVPVAQTNAGAFLPQTRAPVYVAYRNTGAYGGYVYSGGIDELTLYNRALSPAEIQAIVSADQAGKCPPPPPPCAPPWTNLVAWWRAESNTLDSVDSNHGVTTPQLSYGTGVVGRAFLASTAFVQVPASTNLNVGAGPGFTVEGWAWPKAVAGLLSTTADMEFVGWHSWTMTQGVTFGITNVFFPNPFPGASSLVWQADLRDTQGYSHIVRGPADLVALEAWQHVALTYDKASGAASVYFNGTQVTQTNLGTFTPQTMADFNVGYQPTVLPPLPIRPLPTTNRIDEVSLYSRALTADEIRAIAKSRSTGKCMEPPTIVAQPANTRVNEGATATFSVAAAGNPILKYQWRRNGAILLGATGTGLTLTHVQLAQAGTYSVRVTNAFGSVVSSNAALTVNRPPVADASATAALVTSPSHCSPAVVLDGSRSSDPDGDPLRFDWFQDGSANAFATGVVAVVALPPGTNSLTLRVDDGLATDAQTFVVEVISASQAIERLQACVSSECSRPQPLTATLSAATGSADRGNDTSAINQLRAFQNQLRAQVAPSNSGLADALGQGAQRIIDVLRHDCAAKPRGQLARIGRSANGNPHLHFTAPPGAVYIVEASTDLVHWEKIGVAADRGLGQFEFEDTMDSNLMARFYRVLAP